MRIKKLGALLLSVVMLIGMLSVGFVMPASAEETDVEIFHADFRKNSGGDGTATITNNKNGVRDYLLSKFAFYRNQEGMYFERPLVNGYVADADGNSITAQNASKTTKPYAPDTGIAMDGTYIDYTGNGIGPFSQWALEWNEIFCIDRSTTDLDVYRNSNWMYVKDANGDLANLKNFRLEVLFLYDPAWGNNTTFAVLFRGNTAGNPLGTDNQQLFSLYPAQSSAYLGNNFVRNSTQHNLETETMSKGWHIAVIEVVGDKMTATITTEAGNPIFSTTQTLNVLDSGYLGIGGSLRGMAYRDIKVTRLDKDGNAIDFSDENDGWDFYASVHDKGIFRDSLQWMMGNDAAILGYYRDNGNRDFSWLQKVNSDKNFWFLNEMNAENAYDARILSELNAKFDLSFEGQGWARSAGKPLETQFSGHSQSGTARLALFNGRYINAVYSVQGTDGQNNIQKALALRPKKADGSAWQVKNFETTFILNFNASQATSATAFYFRAQNANSFASGAAASAIVFSPKGYQLFDGAGPGNKYDYNAYTAWNGGAISAVRVYVKVVDTQLVLKATSIDGTTVYADTTKTITDGNAGYLYYTLINGNNAIGEIAMSEVTAPVHECDFAEAKYDENNHWNECSCGEKADVAAHEFENDCDTTCDCGYTRTITHNFATAKYDETNHWNECACGEKADVAAHVFESDCDTTCDCGYTRVITHNFATTEHDADGHWTVCACGATTEKVAHDFTEGDCACGEQKPNTAVADEEADVITVKVEEGYQLKAGTLVVTDANGKRFVPERVGYREGGDASEYAIPEGFVGPFTVEAEFYQPTLDELNMGLVGTSVNVERSGLRHVHRVNVENEDGKLYMLADGAKVEVAEYGMLVASGSLLKNAEDLDVETAEQSKHVHQFIWTADSDTKFYDLCDDYADISVHVVNIKTDKYDGSNTPIHSRTYVKLADGTIIHGAVESYTYNEVAGEQ